MTLKPFSPGKAERLGIGARLLAELVRDLLASAERGGSSLPPHPAAAQRGRSRPHRHHPCSDPAHGRVAYRRSQARPAASTVSSAGATNCMFPTASPAQPIRLTQRRNEDSGSRTSSSSASSAGSSIGVARAHVEIDLGLVGAPARERTVRRRDVVGADPLGCLELRPDRVAVLVGAAGKRLPVALGRLVQEQRPHVGGRQPGSPTRRPARRAARGRRPMPLLHRSPRSPARRRGRAPGAAGRS